MKKIVLFGDSITDMGRSHDQSNNSFSYGVGYPIFLKELFIKNNINVDLLNRGCSGDSTTNLLERLDVDVINNKPDIVTILVGINDLWHRLEGDQYHKGNSLTEFENNYTKIIQKIKNNLPNCKILLFSPFFLPLKNDGRDKLWKHLNNLNNYIEIIKKVSKKFEVKLIDIQPLLEQANSKYNTSDILYDGIHPNIRGSLIIANAFYQELKSIL